MMVVLSVIVVLLVEIEMTVGWVQCQRNPTLRV